MDLQEFARLLYALSTALGSQDMVASAFSGNEAMYVDLHIRLAHGAIMAVTELAARALVAVDRVADRNEFVTEDDARAVFVDLIGQGTVQSINAQERDGVQVSTVDEFLASLGFPTEDAAEPPDDLAGPDVPFGP